MKSYPDHRFGKDRGASRLASTTLQALKPCLAVAGGTAQAAPCLSMAAAILASLTLAAAAARAAHPLWAPARLARVAMPAASTTLR